MHLATFTLIDLRRIFSDRAGIFFSIVLPAVFYVIFGAIQDYGDMPLHGGNVAAYVMIGMASYGGIVAACATSGNIVVEQSTGWGRQLALTPISQGALLLSKSIVVLIRAALPVAAVNIVGLFTTASMPAGQWWATAALSIVVAVPFGFYGMIFGLLFRSDSAVSVSSTALVILAFLGNVFSPLPEFLLTVARFTPLYGAASVARYPLSQGAQAISEAPYLHTDPLWYAIINLVAWTVLFTGLCVILSRRKKGRY